MLSLCLGAILLDLVAALTGLVAGSRGGRLVYPATAVAAAITLLAALGFLVDGAQPLATTLPIGLPWLHFQLRLDALSAAFLLIVNLVAMPIGLYAIGYGVHDAEPRRILPIYPIFLAAMNLVPLANDAYSFLLSWELMSLASWLLVLANHREARTAPAALLYIVMASFGTLSLLLAFGVLAGVGGGYGFDAMRQAPPGAGAASLALFLALLGAGSKAGIVPLHAWLPLAHPAAPSHVSALMSGAMTKIALYGLVRILFDLVGAPLWWWGGILLLLGAASALLGVLQAVMQRDLKTLLAYSTVENIGIIVIGLGLALAFKASGNAPLAALALLAALFHAFNHALFKSLLFLGAGSVLVATHERDIERLGGLNHRMASTSLVFLIGSAAISALPPLNGFASEWLIFQAILNGAALPQWLLKFAVPVTGLILALAAALAGVAFVRAYGTAFLGRPRSAAAILARDVGATMRYPMIFLAGLCVAAGIMPSGAVALLLPVARALLGPKATAFAGMSGLWLVPLDPAQSSYSGLITFLVITALVMLLVWVIHRYASARVARGPAWDCGFPQSLAETQYTGSSFAQPIRRVFGPSLLAARESVDMPAPGETRPGRFEASLRDLVWDGLYAPAARLVGWGTERVNFLQFLTIRRYLTLCFGALVLLLAVVAVSQ